VKPLGSKRSYTCCEPGPPYTAKITGYFRVESKGTGFTTEASMRAPSDAVKVNSSGVEYACDASHSLLPAFFSSVRSLRPAVVHSSTCRGWVVDDQ